MKKVIIYTDGACSGNPGPGGWAAILKYGEHSRHLSGGERQTTNNRMEMTAAIKGLEALKERCEVELYSDSAYLIDAHVKRWLDKWQRENWTREKGKEPVLNADLWQRLLELEKRHSVSWHKVKGHAGVFENELCDKLAVEAAELYK